MKLLALFHRLPYPPNKGERIRYYHFLKFLAARHDIWIGCFSDDSDCPQSIDHLRGMCRGVKVVPRQGMLSGTRYILGLVQGKPLSVAYFGSRELQQWVDSVIEAENPDCVAAFSSAMAQFVLNSKTRPQRFVMDFVDMDSDKWVQYAAAAHWPTSIVYGREGRLMLELERKVAASADASVFVSETEVADFLRAVPEASGKVFAIENGVDTDYYDPSRQSVRPFPAETTAITFVGTMDYRPNVDAVQWFVRSVLPRVRAAVPTAAFYVVGARPSRAVRDLAALPGVVVTGMVDDVRPFVAHAALSVAPLRIARGIQNKVLEAMAMEKAVVVTPNALAGVRAEPGRDLLVATTAEETARQVIATLRDGASKYMMQAARRLVLDCYDWRVNAGRLEKLLFPERIA